MIEVRKMDDRGNIETKEIKSIAELKLYNALSEKDLEFLKNMNRKTRRKWLRKNKHRLKLLEKFD